MTAWVTAEIRVRRRAVTRPRASAAARLATTVGLSPPLLIGSRLAVEPGQGRRAVPVRSAMVGAIVGVLGVVGCLTFRAGLSDTVADPGRSGVVWDQHVAGVGVGRARRPSDGRRRPGGRRRRSTRSGRARCASTAPPPRRSGPSPSRVTSTSSCSRVTHRKGGARSRSPRRRWTISEFASVTRSESVTAHGRPMRVVGRALLPATSHTDYDESAWMTMGALRSVAPSPEELGRRGHRGLDAGAVASGRGRRRRASSASRRSAEGKDYFVEPATLSTAVVSLGQLRSLPLALAVFFGLLADRDRRARPGDDRPPPPPRPRRPPVDRLHPRRRTRLAIAWQSTLIAIVGLVVGIPLGIIIGRSALEAARRELPGGLRRRRSRSSPCCSSCRSRSSIANLVAAGPGPCGHPHPPGPGAAHRVAHASGQRRAGRGL